MYKNPSEIPSLYKNESVGHNVGFFLETTPEIFDAVDTLSEIDRYDRLALKTVSAILRDIKEIPEGNTTFTTRHQDIPVPEEVMYMNYGYIGSLPASEAEEREVPLAGSSKSSLSFNSHAGVIDYYARVKFDSIDQEDAAVSAPKALSVSIRSQVQHMYDSLTDVGLPEIDVFYQESFEGKSFEGGFKVVFVPDNLNLPEEEIGDRLVPSNAKYDDTRVLDTVLGKHSLSFKIPDATDPSHMLDGRVIPVGKRGIQGIPGDTRIFLVVSGIKTDMTSV